MSNLQDLFNEKSLNDSKALELKKLEDEHKKKFIAYIANYFGGEIPHYLPLPDGNFISVNTSNFSIECVDNQYFWTTRGRFVKVKDGSSTHGTSEQELSQQEWEQYPEAFQKRTLKDAEKESASPFPITPAIFRGIDWGAIGYILAENKDLNLQLVWRKGGNSWGGRFGGRSTFPSSLQLLNIDYPENTSGKTLLIPDSLKEDKNVLFALKNHSSSLKQGGKFSKALITEFSKFIDTLFGENTANGIIETLSKKSQVTKSGATSRKVEKVKPAPLPDFAKSGQLRL